MSGTGGQLTTARTSRLSRVAHIDNGLGVQNGEQGKEITVCTGLRAPWSVMWPALRTIS